MKKFMILTAFAIAAVGSAEAKVASATPFADNMVFQRNLPVAVWGTADAGEKVTVTFAGQAKTATADAKGAWRVNLDPMPASKESRTITIKGAANEETFKNVLVGEVWFASGQSNMECPIWGPNTRYRDGQGGVMTAMTRRPYIRWAKNKRVWAAQPKYDYKAVWFDYSPESFKKNFHNNLSATAFYYALELYNALDVPVGIVDSSWGGTNIDAWTPRCGYDNHPELKDVADFPTTDKWNNSLRRGVVSGPNQQPSALWNGMVAAWAPYTNKGFIWYQGCHNNGEAARYCDKMHALYDGWAKSFENPDYKLYFVELAPFSCSWFNLQLNQAKFDAEEKNAGMAVVCDVGNNHDIHPNDKESVARRLALHALKRDYGFDNIIDNSPTLKSWRIDGDKFVLTFNDVTTWYAYNMDYSPAKGFEIAGPDGKFKPARLLNGDSAFTLKGTDLVVAAEGVTTPRRLRYLASKPWVGTLYSFDSGLPVGPFEVDARTPGEDRRGEPVKLGAALKIPELAGFRPVLAADLPVGRFAGYSLDKTAQAGAFSRVAYVLELERRDGTVDWAMAAMDAFTTDAAKLGLPMTSGVMFQQKVANLTVRANRKSVKEVTNDDGGSIEFFKANYGQGAKLPGIGGDPQLYDFNDDPDLSHETGYGCLQIHNWKDATTVLAYNHFTDDGASDIGIGNGTEEHADWTFAQNAGLYKTRRLTILVK